jgi:hypothetical protein
MKNITPLKFLIVALISLVSTSLTGETIEKKIENDKIELDLKPLDKEAKFGVIRYEIPDLYRKKLDSLVSTRLLTDILSHGAKVCFKFEREKVAENDFKQLSEFGTYIVSVEPKIFKTGDTIVIGVNNLSLGN